MKIPMLLPENMVPALSTACWDISPLSACCEFTASLVISACTTALEGYDAMSPAVRIEEFVEGLSNWYVRRSRRRFWRSEDDGDKRAAYDTLYTCLTTVIRLMAPMTPFLVDDVYQNLVRGIDALAPESVHICPWPEVDEALIDRDLSVSVRLVQRLTSLGRAARSKANIKVRQPLAAVHMRIQSSSEADVVFRMADELMEELNVKNIDPNPGGLGNPRVPGAP